MRATAAGRRKLSGAVIGLVAVAGCSLYRVPAGEFEPVRYTEIIPAQCEPLFPERTDTLQVSDSINAADERDRLVLDFPDRERLTAQLIVPRSAIAAGSTVTFTMRAPANSPYAYVAIGAVDQSGEAVTTFQDEIMVLLRVEDRRCQFSSDPGLSRPALMDIDDRPPEDVMRGDDPDSLVVRQGGAYGNPPFGPAEARGLLDGFSGFILAQGRR